MNESRTSLTLIPETRTSTWNAIDMVCASWSSEKPVILSGLTSPHRSESLLHLRAKVAALYIRGGIGNVTPDLAQYAFLARPICRCYQVKQAPLKSAQKTH